MYADYRAPVFVAIAATACATGGEDLSDLEARVAALEAENETLREDLEDALTAADLAGYVQTSALEAYATDADLAACALDSDLAAYASLTDLDDYALTADLDDYALTADLDDYALADEAVGVMNGGTLNVPSSEYPTIAAALSSLANRRLLAPVQILIAADTDPYVLDERLIVNHPDCHYLTIRGGSGVPAHTVLSAVAGAFEVRGCKGLTIEDLTIAGPGGYVGVLAVGAHITVQDVVIRDFGIALNALRGAYVEATDVVVEDSPTGVSATYGSFVELSGGSVTGSDAGIVASYSSTVTTYSVDMSDNSYDVLPQPLVTDSLQGSTVFAPP